MEEYFKNKYKVNTARLQDWDYCWPGLYYVTICTKDRICCLGEIKNGLVYFSEIGKIVFGEWLRTQELRPYIKLDDWIIMPNHLHGIIGIGDNDFALKNRRDTARINVLDKNDFGLNNCRDAVHRVSTGNNFGPLRPKSLSSIINNFKGAVVRNCHKNNLYFQWQNNYYEHIIRDEDDLARIKEYIAQNPINWEND